MRQLLLTVNHNIAHAHGRPYLDESKAIAGQRTIALDQTTIAALHRRRPGSPLAAHVELKTMQETLDHTSYAFTVDTCSTVLSEQARQPALDE
ncbi:hypothetical protein ACFQS1_35245 [Paractinoplanes rhizophilus]|uniref:Uncharacterized protein n=1 Tax=Paractinoplanes rhizophilus TaxID=1416877 RepID=A0ABW2I322_9ACTN